MRTNIFFLFIFIVLMAFPFNGSYARGSDFSNVKLISAGVSINYNYGYIGSRSMLIPPSVAYFEVGVHEFITIGPFAAYSRWSYPTRTRSFVNLGVRGSFHLSPLINDLLDGSIDERKIDFYASMISGIELRQYGASDTESVSDFLNNTRFFLGPVAGVRYYFTDQLGVFSEVGRGALGAFTVGMSMRL